MDASKASADSRTGPEPGKPLVGDGVTFLPNHPEKVSSYSLQTFNGSQTMNSHNSGSAAPMQGATAPSVICTSGGIAAFAASAASGDSVPSKGLHPPANSVIQTPLMNPVSVAAAGQATGPTVTLVRPPMQTAGPGATFNGNSAASTAVTSSSTNQPGSGAQIPLVNNGQASNSAGSHIIKAEPPTTIIQSAQQPTGTPGTFSGPRAPVMTAGGVTSHVLTPRLPQTPTGQPSVHNIQMPPVMVLLRNEVGQLMMFPQQAVAQMQGQSQGGMAPRTAAPANVSTGQTPGNAVINRQVSPGTIIRQSGPASAPLTATTVLHRPPILADSVGATAPGLTSRTLSQTAGTTVTSVTVSKETLENVKKCQNFFSTLIKLTSNGKQSTETAASVRSLVKDLLESKLEAEEFTSRLYKELNSVPQPYLVPFLKRSLPALRQLTPDAVAFIQQSQLPQPTSGPVSTPPISTTVVLSSPAPRHAAPVCRPQLQSAINSPQTTSLVLQPQQQRTILRPQVPSSPLVALRSQAPGRIMVGQQQALSVPLRSEVPLVPKQISAAALTLAQKNKLKEASSAFKDEDDFNDVASMAGVNLSEESANILTTNSELVGAVTHSCKDEAFLSSALLQRRMLEIGRKHGVMELGPEVVNYVSHATQQRLQSLLENVSLVALQKNMNFKEDDNSEQISDVRAQLKFFEQLDQLEKQRKEEQEREILLKAAKSRARQEDPEQLRLKQKAKEMQQQELAEIRQREANLTALAAIGPRKKRKNLDSPSSSASAEGSGAGSSLTGGAGSSGSRPTRQRITRVNLRDLLFCLENERFTSRSQFLYKGFLK
ncbi:transcription initiation factor TFIID subunit 4-like isoform X3 [Nothobranchius furzeri]|uniref:TAF4 RNA polymerase II, TATA box binding protein (TBP)-associated factor, 135kDa n=1 Tax=Nothobranchius furzeri TaxID=105023 RepID=A0A1A8U393_NOTFU|nr:transcript variant X2 [Nothobranchius furzeri]